MFMKIKHIDKTIKPPVTLKMLAIGKKKKKKKNPELELLRNCQSC